eukprot:g45522.t1
MDPFYFCFMAYGVLYTLEQDIKKLKADLQSSRQCEQELRSQINSLTSTERSIRSEVGQLRQENELLQNKLHTAVQAKQKDKQTISQLEKKLKAEQEAKTYLEKQLVDEKKRKKLEEATAARAVALAAATRGECTETLRSRIRDLETECKKLTIDMKVKEDQIRELEMKVQPSTHPLDIKDTYVRLLLVDYSSTFNAITSSRLISELHDPGLSSALCNWILSFLTHRPQSVKIERKEENTPLYINGTEIERVKNIVFLGMTITDKP